MDSVRPMAPEASAAGEHSGGPSRKESKIVSNQAKRSFELDQPEGPASRMAGRLAILAAVLLPLTMAASENVPHRPFAYWANLPAPRQFMLGLVYEESESYHIWAADKYNNVTVKSGGESYGIDINQGYLALQYGIKEKWAADLNFGATTVGWRKFDSNESAQSTTGLMDWSFGVRYQAYNELKQTNLPWMPTLTLRAGAVLPGSYNKNFAFAPGLRSAAIEPEVLARKHFGWPGLGAFGDALYRWNRTTGNDQCIVSIGLFQQIKGWELDAGYRHLQTLSGGDIIYDPNDPGGIYYPREVRENNDAFEAGFSYTTSKRRIRYGFYSRTVFDGNNSDRKFWVGASIDIPIGGARED